MVLMGASSKSKIVHAEDYRKVCAPSYWAPARAKFHSNRCQDTRIPAWETDLPAGP